MKSCFVFLGKKKARIELEKTFRNNPPLLYGKPLKIETQGTYLGEELGVDASKSVSLTINKQIGLATKAIFEITRPEVSEGGPAITSLIRGVAREEADRHRQIKVAMDLPF